MTLLGRFLEFSDVVRPGYSESLGISSEALFRTATATLPGFSENLGLIYREVLGTSSGSCSEGLVDFVPGYRLLHLSELAVAAARARQAFPEAEGAVPFLENYAGDFWGLTESGVWSLMHDDAPVSHVHASIELMLETHAEVYASGGYLLEKGLLAANADTLLVIGRRMNPGLGYWT